MKKILCLLCILALSAGLLAACGKSDPPPPPPNDEITTEAMVNQGDGDPAQPANNGGDINNFGDLAEAFSGLSQMFSVTWPENEYTKQVPTPKFETSLGIPVEDGFGALTAATVDQLKDYAKDLQKAGFTKDASTTDEAMFGFVVYNYAASNSKGYRVEITYSMGMSAIQITKG